MSSRRFHKRGNKRPGTWRLAIRNLLQTPLLYCPACSAEIKVDPQEVLPDGSVARVIDCPYGGCAWRDVVILEGWEG